MVGSLSSFAFSKKNENLGLCLFETVGATYSRAAAVLVGEEEDYGAKKGLNSSLNLESMRVVVFYFVAKSTFTS